MEEMSVGETSGTPPNRTVTKSDKTGATLEHMVAYSDNHINTPNSELLPNDLASMEAKVQTSDSQSLAPEPAAENQPPVNAETGAGQLATASNQETAEAFQASPEVPAEGQPKAEPISQQTQESETSTENLYLYEQIDRNCLAFFSSCNSAENAGVLSPGTADGLPNNIKSLQLQCAALLQGNKGNEAPEATKEAAANILKTSESIAEKMKKEIDSLAEIGIEVHNLQGEVHNLQEKARDLRDCLKRHWFLGWCAKTFGGRFKNQFTEYLKPFSEIKISERMCSLLNLEKDSISKSILDMDVGKLDELLERIDKDLETFHREQSKVLEELTIGHLLELANGNLANLRANSAEMDTSGLKDDRSMALLAPIGLQLQIFLGIASIPSNDSASKEKAIESFAEIHGIPLCNLMLEAIVNTMENDPIKQNRATALLDAFQKKHGIAAKSDQ